MKFGSPRRVSGFVIIAALVVAGIYEWRSYKLEQVRDARLKSSIEKIYTNYYADDGTEVKAPTSRLETITSKEEAALLTGAPGIFKRIGEKSGDFILEEVTYYVGDDSQVIRVVGAVFRGKTIVSGELDEGYGGWSLKIRDEDLGKMPVGFSLEQDDRRIERLFLFPEDESIFDDLVSGSPITVEMEDIVQSERAPGLITWTPVVKVVSP